MKLPEKIRGSIKILMTVAVLIFLYANLDVEKFGDIAGQVSWFWVVVALTAFAVEMLLSAWKTAWLLGKPSSWPVKLRINCVKVFVNQIVPSGLGGEAARVLTISRDAGSVGRAAVVVLLDRLSGFYAQLAATLISLAFLMGHSSRVTVNVLAVGSILALLGTFLLPFLFRKAIPTLAKQARKMAGRNFPGEGKDAAEFEAAWNANMGSFNRFAAMLAISLGMQAVLIVLTVAAGRAVGADVTAWQASPILLLGTLSTLAPLTVGNLGVTEGAFALGFVFFGFSAESGVAASLVMRAVLFPAAAYGGWVMGKAGIRRAFTSREQK